MKNKLNYNNGYNVDFINFRHIRSGEEPLLGFRRSRTFQDLQPMLPVFASILCLGCGYPNTQLQPMQRPRSNVSRGLAITSPMQGTNDRVDSCWFNELTQTSKETSLTFQLHTIEFRSSLNKPSSSQTSEFMLKAGETS